MISLRRSITYNLLLKTAYLAVIALAYFYSSVHAAPPAAQARGTAAKAAGGAATTAPAKYYTGKRFTTFEGREISREQATQELLSKLDEEIATLGRVLRTKADPEQRADINYRIATNLKNSARVRYFMAVERYEKEYEKAQKGQRSGKPEFPKENYAAAIERLQSILAKYPEYSGTDSVLFELGALYGKSGSDQALSYFEQLTSRFPMSRYALEAEYLKGEYYFEGRKLDLATRSFRAVLAYGDTPLYTQALYKLGWCYYNQGRKRQAVETLKQVIEQSGRGGSRRESELKEEALNDLVVFYSEIEGATDEAEGYFARMGKPGLTKKVLQKLSGVYYDQARWENAIVMYRKLIDFDPKNQEVPGYHEKVITAYRKSGDMAKAIGEMEAYIDRYYANPDHWVRYNKKNPEAVADAEKEAEKYLRFICQYHHQAAQKNKDQKLYAVSAAYYEKYLKLFPKTPQAYEMRYFYAEILYQLARYEDAGEQYEQVAAADLKGKYLKPSSFAAVLCWDTLEKKEYEKLEQTRERQRKNWKEMMAKRQADAKEIPPPPIDIKPIKPSKFAERLIQASSNFVRWIPSEPKVPEILYKVPKTYYNYNQFPQALDGFKSVIQRFPSHAVATMSRNLILDIYNLQQDWDNLRLWATNFLHDRYFGPQNKDFLLDLIQGAMFKKAVVLESEKKNFDAANLYVELTENYPTSKYAEAALYNSAINFMVAGRPDLAIENSKRFINRFPKSPLVEKTLLGLARYFENLADFVNAAEYFEMLAYRVPQSSHAADSLFNAGLYRENLGQYDRAVKNYDEYIRRYPKNHDAAELFFAKAMMAIKLTDWSQAATLFGRYPSLYVDADRVLEALYREGQAYAQLGQQPKAEAAYRKTIRTYERYQKEKTPIRGGRKYVAKVEMEMIEPMVKEYDDVKLVMPQRKLAQAIERKAVLLKTLRDRYMKVINYGDAEVGIEALFRIGKSYQKFSSALFSAPVPKNLNPEELDLYQTELEKRAQPIEEKAIEAFKEALEKSYKLAILTPYTMLAYEQLSQYRPNEYPIHRGLKESQRLITSALFSYGPVMARGQAPKPNLHYPKPEVK